MEGLDTNEAELQDVDSGLESLYLKGEEESNDDNLEFEDLAQDVNRGWAYAANQYLKLICSHKRALKALCHPEDTHISRRIAGYFNKAQLKLVDVQPEAKDTSMAPYDEVLRILLPNEQDLEGIRTWLRNYGAASRDVWDRSEFKGTWHCEAILLSLHALSVCT